MTVDWDRLPQSSPALGLRSAAPSDSVHYRLRTLKEEKKLTNYLLMTYKIEASG